MSDNLFKRAYVRGLNTELMRNGIALYPSKKAADHAADYVADNSNMPDPFKAPEKITAKTAEFLCDQLVVASRELCKQAGNKYNSTLSKTAAAVIPADAARTAATEVMQKAAAETGSLMEGGDDPNHLADDAKDNGESALEENRRPEGYAHLGEKGVGGYEDKGRGAVGTEETAPEAPKATGHDTNSAIENVSAEHKSASLAAMVRKVATMGLMTPGGDANSLAAASKANAEAAQEENRRAEGYALVGVGKTEMPIGGAAEVGVQKKHPLSPAASAPGTNSLSLGKQGAFESLFEDTAKQIVPYLPEKMADATKVAHVRANMGLELNERAAYLRDLYESLGTTKEASVLVHNHFLKSAGEMPAAFREHMEEKKSEGKSEHEEPMKHEGNPFAAKSEEKTEEKAEAKEEKEDEPKKEASVAKLSNLRAAIANLTK